MTAIRTRRLAGLGALALGAGFFIVFPTLGLLEALAGVVVLAAQRSTDRTVSLVAIPPTILILAFAIAGMVTSSGMDARIIVAIAIVSAITSLVLLRMAVATTSPRPQVT
jgi:hypothetical protein